MITKEAPSESVAQRMTRGYVPRDPVTERDIRLWDDLIGSDARAERGEQGMAPNRLDTGKTILPPGHDPMTEADLWEWYRIYDEQTKTIATLTAERDRFIAERDEAVEVGKRTIRTLTAERDMWANRHLRPEYEWATLTAERDAWKATAENNAMIAEERWQRVKELEGEIFRHAELHHLVEEAIPWMPEMRQHAFRAALKPSGEER